MQRYRKYYEQRRRESRLRELYGILQFLFLLLAFSGASFAVLALSHITEEKAVGQLFMGIIAAIAGGICYKLLPKK